MASVDNTPGWSATLTQGRGQARYVVKGPRGQMMHLWVSSDRHPRKLLNVRAELRRNGWVDPNG